MNLFGGFLAGSESDINHLVVAMGMGWQQPQSHIESWQQEQQTSTAFLSSESVTSLKLVDELMINFAIVNSKFSTD